MNYDLLRDINNLSVHDAALNHVMIWSAKYVVYLVFAALAVLVIRELRRRRWVPAGAVVASLVCAYLFGLAAAAIHHEKRPFTTHPNIHQLVPHAAGNSFPSDHATASFAIALAVIVYISVRWGLALFVAALLIGFARVYDGLHYPGDIGGGLLVAVLGVCVVALAARLARLARPHLPPALNAAAWPAPNSPTAARARRPG